MGDVAVAERPKTMAKRTNDVSTKVDAEALRLAKMAAEIKGITLAQYVSEVVIEHASQFLDAWAAARVKKSGNPPGKK